MFMFFRQLTKKLPPGLLTGDTGGTTNWEEMRDKMDELHFPAGLTMPYKKLQVSSKKISWAAPPVCNTEVICFQETVTSHTFICTYTCCTLKYPYPLAHAHTHSLYAQMNRNTKFETEKLSKWRRGISKSLVHLVIILMGLLPSKGAIIGPLYQCHTGSQ